MKFSNDVHFLIIIIITTCQFQFHSIYIKIARRTSKVHPYKGRPPIDGATIRSIVMQMRYCVKSLISSNKFYSSKSRNDFYFWANEICSFKPPPIRLQNIKNCKQIANGSHICLHLRSRFFSMKKSLRYDTQLLFFIYQWIACSLQVLHEVEVGLNDKKVIALKTSYNMEYISR